ncbi:DUF554 domain-containing protein [Velocimicrobium porci]|uniref:DUF554 domain-containing protein n=1 Tax=Velocimicrobium porci TaxID=2606634 RepID=UPI00197BC52D|nr:DUF554 domain-containing protein [Velocimicrobium porci]
MCGLGTVVNVLAIVVGSILGLSLRGKLSQRFQDILMQVLGIATMFIGVSGALKGMLVIENGKLDTSNVMLMIVSLVLGALIGEGFRLEQRMEQLGEWFKRLAKIRDDSCFVEGFVNASLVVCIGAMAVVGAIEDGIAGNSAILFAKAMLDFVIVMVFASTLGIGVLFSAIPLGLYQGSISIFARIIKPLLTEEMITSLSFVGAILIFAVGVNLSFGKKFRVGNMLPALFVPVLYEFIIQLFR